MSVQVMASRSTPTVAVEPFLRIPPFPGCKSALFAADHGANKYHEEEAENLAELLRNLKVGGTFWAPQPQLPERYLLVRSVAALESAIRIACDAPVVLWSPRPQSIPNEALIIVTGECDPWHMVAGAVAVVGEADEVGLVARLAGKDTYHCDESGRLYLQNAAAPALIDEGFSKARYRNPFTNEPMSLREAIELCAFWRRLIDSNRGLQGGLGFAFWKRENVGTLLWGGSEPFRFLRTASEIENAEAPIAVWRSKAPTDTLEAVSDVSQIEVEDGFLRSQGLGADCIPPLSITVDRLGAYFDPGRPSELENLLQNGEFDDQSLERARNLRHVIVEAGLSKYSRGDESIARSVGSRRHILVPGQVEDDRSVQLGGCGLTSNLDLLARVREEAPDAYILYKPHPDVLAGHRKGTIPENQCLQYADEIVGEESISALIGMVDEVHVNTSLAGFEALMRGKPVTTFGVPFYAGWGLTRDLGPVPARRSTVRTLDELVAAALLAYPRYLDPTTGLPCPPEVVVARLIAGNVPETNLLVVARRIQGKVLRSVRSLVK